MSQRQRKPSLYAPHARFNGALDFLCPFCGSIGKYRITWAQYRLRCVGCRRYWGFALHILELDRYGHGPTKEPTPPQLIFPEVHVRHWKHGDPLHTMQVIEETEAASVAG